MARYEIMYLVSPKIKDENLDPLLEQIKTVTAKHKGKIVEEIDLGKKKLAYPIKHFRHGFYHVTYIDLPAENVDALEKDLRLLDDILRYLIVKHTDRTFQALADQKKQASERLAREEEEAAAGGKEEDKEESTPPKETPAKTEEKSEPKPIPKPELKDKKVGIKPKDTEKQARKAEDKKEKAKLDELDKKLDEILDDDIID